MKISGEYKMLHIYKSFSELDIEQLMLVYLQGNLENGSLLYPECGENEQRRRAEDDFISYLREDFFSHPNAFYAVWAPDGCYKAALRLEPYRDGLLLEALETAPEARRQGYATVLIRKVMSYLQPLKWTCIYSHIHKRNIASLNVHKKCGFQIISDSATYIDGTVTQSSYTLRYDF